MKKFKGFAIDQFSINQNVLLISNETIFKNLLGNVKIKKKDISLVIMLKISELSNQWTNITKKKYIWETKSNNIISWE